MLHGCGNAEQPPAFDCSRRSYISGGASQAASSTPSISCVYHQKEEAMVEFTEGLELNELDRYAISILRKADKTSRKLNTAQKREADLKCVAVAAVDKTLYVAANNLWITKDMQNEVSQYVTASKKGGPDAVPRCAVKGDGGYKTVRDFERDVGKSVANAINKGDPLADHAAGVLSFWDKAGRKIIATSGERFDKVQFLTDKYFFLNVFHAEMQLLQYFIINELTPNPP
jgi:hypothetical protein